MNNLCETQAARSNCICDLIDANFKRIFPSRWSFTNGTSDSYLPSIYKYNTNASKRTNEHTYIPMYICKFKDAHENEYRKQASYVARTFACIIEQTGFRQHEIGNGMHRLIAGWGTSYIVRRLYCSVASSFKQTSRFSEALERVPLYLRCALKYKSLMFHRTSIIACSFEFYWNRSCCCRFPRRIFSYRGNCRETVSLVHRLVQNSRKQRKTIWMRKSNRQSGRLFRGETLKILRDSRRFDRWNVPLLLEDGSSVTAPSSPETVPTLRSSKVNLEIYIHRSMYNTFSVILQYETIFSRVLYLCVRIHSVTTQGRRSRHRT